MLLLAFLINVNQFWALCNPCYMTQTRGRWTFCYSFRRNSWVMQNTQVLICENISTLCRERQKEVLSYPSYFFPRMILFTVSQSHTKWGCKSEMEMEASRTMILLPKTWCYIKVRFEATWYRLGKWSNWGLSWWLLQWAKCLKVAWIYLLVV